MLKSLDTIKEKVAPVAKKHNLSKVYLCGSYAKGYATDKSDIDLCVDFADYSTVGMFKLVGVWNDFTEALNSEVDLMTLHDRKEFIDQYMIGSKLLYG